MLLLDSVPAVPQQSSSLHPSQSDSQWRRTWVTFRTLRNHQRDRADSGEIGDQLFERDVKGWNYEDESYWQMVDCAIEIAHAAIKHSGKKAKK